MLGYDVIKSTLEEGRALGSYLTAGELPDSATICLNLTSPRLRMRVERTGKPAVIVVKPFEPSETPAEIVRWYLSLYPHHYPQPAVVGAASFQPMHFDGAPLDDGVAISEQGVTRERMVVLTEADSTEVAAPLGASSSSSAGDSAPLSSSTAVKIVAHNLGQIPFSFWRAGGVPGTPQRRTPWGPADIVQCSYSVNLTELGAAPTVASLKAFIEDREGIPPARQALYYIFNARPVLVADDARLAELPAAVHDSGLFLLRLRLDVYERDMREHGMREEDLREVMAADGVGAAGIASVIGVHAAVA
jgi:hypothetical protein